MSRRERSWWVEVHPELGQVGHVCEEQAGQLWVRPPSYS